MRTRRKDHILIFTTHQIVCDGWSVNVFFRELETLYGSHFNGKPVSIPDLPLQFADYAVWQRQHLQGEFLKSQLSYWKKQVGNSLPFLDLPTDRRRPPSQSFRGTRIAVALPEDLAKALNELSRQAGVTLFHDVASSVQGFAPPIHGPGRYRCWFPGCQQKSH